MAWNILNDIDKAWIAGIFEGEGTIGNFARYKDKKYMRLLIYNNDMSMLLELQKMIGGLIYKRTYGKRKNMKNCKDSYSLTINKRDEILTFMSLISPYIRSEYKLNQIKKTIRGD